LALHGDMMHHDRMIVMKDFKDGKIKVLVSTNIASRGLDIP